VYPAPAIANTDRGRTIARATRRAQRHFPATHWPQPETSAHRRPDRQGLRHAHFLRQPWRLRHSLRPKPRPPELARRIGRLGWRLFQDAENYRPRQPGTADDLFGVRPPGGRERQPGHRPRRCLLPVAALTVTAMFGERAESRLGARRPTRPKRACNPVTAMNDFTHILSNIQQGGPHAAD